MPLSFCPLRCSASSLCGLSLIPQQTPKSRSVRRPLTSWNFGLPRRVRLFCPDEIWRRWWRRWFIPLLVMKFRFSVSWLNDDICHVTLSVDHLSFRPHALVRPSVHVYSLFRPSIDASNQPMNEHTCKCTRIYGYCHVSSFIFSFTNRLQCSNGL